MITYINGIPRAGKTSYVVANIINDHMKLFNPEYYLCLAEIKKLNQEKGFNLTIPLEKHVVFANFDIYRKYPTMKNYNISGFEFGIPNKYAPEVKRLCPYGVYVFDECQRYWPSKSDGSPLPWWVTRAFELHGHGHITMFLIAQRYMKLHIDIRDLVERFIYVEKSIHTFIVDGKKVISNKFIPGQLIKTKWLGKEFMSRGEYEKFLAGDIKLGKVFSYEFKGDIRDHYDPWSYADDLQNCDSDFDYESELNDERPSSWDNWKKEQKKKSG